MNNNYNRILNLVVNEGLSTGASPTQTGIRVGSAMARYKAGSGVNYPTLIQAKKDQVKRIMHKTAKRQEDLVSSYRLKVPDLGTVHGVSQEAEDAHRTEREKAIPNRSPRKKRSEKQKTQDAAERGDTYAQASQRFRKGLPSEN